MSYKKILCIGGSGSLGVHLTKALLPHQIYNIDFNQCQNAKVNLLLNKNQNAVQNNRKIISQIKKQNSKFDSIIVTAGGWIGGSIKDQDYLSKTKHMIDLSLIPSLLGAHLAYHYLNDNGLVVFSGAASVFKQPQPDMIAYSIAKTGVHSLALNLTQTLIQLGKNQKVVTILPETIDTKMNRQSMPKSDFSKWSKPQQIGQLVRGWVDGYNVPNNGSFAVLKVKNGCVNPQFV